MTRTILNIFALCALSVQSLAAHDLSGQWQGTLPVQGGIRLILKVTQSENGALSAGLINIDQSPQETPVKSVTLAGSTFRFDFNDGPDRYEGTLSDDGKTIAGKWYGARHPETPYVFDLHLASGADMWVIDSSPHQVRFVTVDNGIKLEVLDWGGTGRPLVLLAGLGNDAHIFDQFAPKLTPTYHVYGITRRGFGVSDKPEPADENYAVDRLGDDVLEVIAALKIDRPVVAGHSIAGQELSSLGSRHPEKIAGLIYLDSAYPYAFYDRAQGDFRLDLPIVQQKLARLGSILTPTRDDKTLANEVLDTDLPQLVKSLERMRQELNSKSEAALAMPKPPDSREARITQAVIAGGRKYTEIKCPVLAIFAVETSPAPGSDNPFALTQVELDSVAAEVKAFEAGVPTARVVRIPNADHYVFKSNEADVLREMNDFLTKLP